MSGRASAYGKYVLSGLTIIALLCPVAHASGNSSTPAKTLMAQASARAESNQQEGITDKEINVGSCIALTGTLQERGHQIVLGANTYLSYINGSGGVNGRQIKLTACDDGYQAEKAIECFNTCLKNKVFMGGFFIGSTPISKYTRMGDVSKIPLFGFCTGTPVIYDLHPTEFVLRASYTDEMQRQITELEETRGLKRIAILYQNDAYGTAIRANAISELKKYNLTPVAEASYSRLTANIDEAFNQVKGANPQVLLLGATSDALKAVIKKKAEEKWNALCMCPSIATDYLGDLGKDAEGIVLSQVVPSFDDRMPAAALYNKLRKKYSPDAQPSMSAFEGFFNAMVMTEVLKECGRDLTRDKFIKTMESMHNRDFGLGPNFKVSFSPTKHAAWNSESVYFQTERNGKLVTMTQKDWKELLKAHN